MQLASQMKRRNWSVKLVLFMQTAFYTALGERGEEKVLHCNLHSLSLIIFVAGTLRHCRHAHGLRSRGREETGQHQSINTETALEPKTNSSSPIQNPFHGTRPPGAVKTVHKSNYKPHAAG